MGKEGGRKRRREEGRKEGNKLILALKSTTTKVKVSLDGIVSRSAVAGESVIKLEGQSKITKLK